MIFSSVGEDVQHEVREGMDEDEMRASLEVGVRWG